MGGWVSKVSLWKRELNKDIASFNRLKAGIAHLQMSLAKNSAEGIALRLVTKCNPANNLLEGGLQMALCVKWVE